jgi:predicted  nucleic acid-binding Zn-ribbon protein
LNQSIDELEARKVALENKLDEMKSASGDEWESFKADVERASQDLESAFNNLQAAFEEALSEV